MSGLNSDGFTRKTLSDIQEDIKERLNLISDDGVSLDVDRDENSPIIQLVNAFSASIGTLWEALEDVFNASNIDNATGFILDGTAGYNGITRLKAEKSTVILKFVGTAGLEIPAGTEFSNTKEDKIFILKDGVTLDSSGEAEAEAEAETEGDTQVTIGEINNDLSNLSGLTSVTNEAVAEVGRFLETDAELKTRQRISTETPSINLTESIRAGVLGVLGVKKAVVDNNIENTTNSRGTAANSIAIIVQGGEDEDVANAIFLRSDTIRYDGTTTVTISGNLGKNYDIKFSRPTIVDIFINLDISIIDSSIYPANAEELIKSNLIDYIENSNIGDNVIYSRLFTPINNVAGHTVNSLTISSDNTNYVTNDIDIDFSDLANLIEDNINLTVA